MLTGWAICPIIRVDQGGEIMTKTIKEQVIEMGNNETAVAKGVYKNEDGTYLWLTFTRSGTCKKLSTAMKNAGF